MSIPANTVDVGALGTSPDIIPAQTLDLVLGEIFGKAVWAANNVGAALYKADAAQATADTIQGIAQYAADKAGYLEYHLQQIALLVNYTGMSPSIVATSLEEHKQAVYEEALQAGQTFAVEAQAARELAADEE